MHFVTLLYDILFNFVYKIAIIDGNCVEKKNLLHIHLLRT